MLKKCCRVFRWLLIDYLFPIEIFLSFCLYSLWDHIFILGQPLSSTIFPMVSVVHVGFGIWDNLFSPSDNSMTCTVSVLLLCFI